MKEILLKLIDWYATRFSFPHRGLKYFIYCIKQLKLLDFDFRKKTKDGIYFSLDLKDHIQRQIFWYGTYEKKYSQFLLDLLKPGEVFFDLGANIGYYSLLAASKVGKTGQIHSFEPSSSAFRRIEKNLGLNKFDNIVLNNTGVSQINEKRILFLSSGENTAMSGLSKAYNFSGNEELVQLISLDQYIAERSFSRIDVIKIDIEGHELHALKGMNNLINQFKPLLLLEISNPLLYRFEDKAADIYAFLRAKGYLPYQLTDDQTVVEIQHDDSEDDLVIFIHAMDERMKKLIDGSKIRL